MNIFYTKIIKAKAIQVNFDNLEHIKKYFATYGVVVQNESLVYFDGGNECAKNGDWLVKEPNEDIYSLSNLEFIKQFKAQYND